MNNNYYDDEEEINIKYILYKIALKYKQLLIVGLVCMIVAACFYIAKSALPLLNEEDRQEAYTEYQRELRVYDLQCQNYENQIELYKEQVESQISSQIEYNDKSLLFDIDFNNVYKYSFNILIEQNVTNSEKLTALSYYSNLINNGLVQYLTDNTDLTDNSKYIKELVSLNSYDSGMISVTIIAKDQSTIDRLAQLTKDYLNQNALNQIEVSISDETTFVEIDNNLKSVIDAKNINSVDELETLEDNYKDYKKEKPYYIISIKELIKYILIGLFVGLFVAAVYYGCTYIFSSKLVGTDYFEYRNINLLGSINKNCDNNKVVRYINKIFGYNDDVTSVEQQIYYLASSISGITTSKNVAIIATESLEKVEEIVASLNKKSTIKYSFAGNTLFDGNAVDKLKKIKDVVIVCQQEQTKIDDINTLVNNLKLYNKNLLGVINLG